MDKLLNVAGRVAIVWGGGAGMGEATVKRLAEAGCAVGVVDVDAAAAERVAKAIVGAAARRSPPRPTCARRTRCRRRSPR